MESQLRISISNVAGETLEVEFLTTDPIASVKHVVARRWAIPCSCQKLLLDAEVLKDDDVIELVIRSATIGACGVVMNVVVSLDVVRSNMNSQDTCPDVRAQKRVFALRELGILGMKGGSASIAIVVNSLEEKDERVCAAAVDALRQFAARGNQQIIAALLPKLKHKRSNVKKLALELLRELAEVGDRDIVAEIVACFEQHAASTGVPEAAVATLLALALQGDQEHIVGAVTSLIFHRSKMVRKAAVEALIQFSEMGIVIGLSAWVGCLEDSQPEVRTATLKAMAKFCGKGDQDALTAVCGCVGDTEGKVRLAALCAISKIAEKGDKDAQKAVSFLVKDAELPVRLAALCAFAEIADKRPPPPETKPDLVQRLFGSIGAIGAGGRRDTSRSEGGKHEGDSSRCEEVSDQDTSTTCGASTSCEEERLKRSSHGCEMQ
jgi:HEAT repeat protein